MLARTGIVNQRSVNLDGYRRKNVLLPHFFRRKNVDTIHFFFHKRGVDHKFYAFELAIQWLTDAGLLYKVHKVAAPSMPLKAYVDCVAFKLFIQRKTDIIPLEVKAEDNLKSRSLKAYCEKFSPAKAFRISTANYRKQDWMENIPLWSVCGL